MTGSCVRAETERGARRFAIYGQARYAVPGGRAEGVQLRAVEHPQQSCTVVGELGAEAARPERDRARHRRLHVGVTGQGDAALLHGDALERCHDAIRRLRERVDRVAQIETQRDEHLIVARPAEMDAAAGFADALREPALERAVHVLVGELDRPLAGRVRGRERFEARADRVAVGGAEELLLLEHTRVRD